jgi:hypothetical protein
MHLKIGLKIEPGITLKIECAFRVLYIETTLTLKIGLKIEPGITLKIELKIAR